MTETPIKQETRIIGFTESGDLKVRLTVNEKVSESIMTRSAFLDEVLFQSDNSGCQSTGYATLDTEFGNRFCKVYENDDSQYWVGEHDIIYKHSLHGMIWRLTETSLIIK